MVKIISSNFLYKFSPQTNFCQYQNALISSEDIHKNLGQLEQMLGVQPDTNYHFDILEDTFEEAAEQFLYLTTCPNRIKDWVSLFKSLLENSSPKLLILSLNRFLKASDNSYIKPIATKLLAKVQNYITLYYGDIDSLTSNVPKSSQTFKESGMKSRKEDLLNVLFKINPSYQRLPTTLCMCWIAKETLHHHPSFHSVSLEEM